MQTADLSAFPDNSCKTSDIYFYILTRELKQENQLQ